MTLSQILELITSFIGSLVFTSGGNPQPGSFDGGSSGLLKGFGYVLGLVSPLSSNYSPLIMFIFILAFLGLGIGLIKRLIKL